jgi:hypothetical protein
MWSIHICTHIMEHSSHTKKNEILSFAGICLYLEEIMLSEIKQAHRKTNDTCSQLHVQARKQSQ